MKFLTHKFIQKSGKKSLTPVAGPIIDANGFKHAQAKAKGRGFKVNGFEGFESRFSFSGLLPA